MTKHILLYMDDPGFSGVAHHSHQLLCHLTNLGYQLSHAQFRHSSPMVTREQELGVKQIWLDFNITLESTRCLKDFHTPEQIFLQSKPDLIIFSDGWPFANFAAKQAAAQLNIPYIIVLHWIDESSDKFSYPGDGLKYIDLCSYHYNKAQQVIAVSQQNFSLLQEMLDLPANHGKVIYNGVPSKFFAPPDPSIRQRLRQEIGVPPEAVVCFTGARLARVKGFQYQLEAIKRLKDTPIWPLLYFVWAGSGAESYDNIEPALKETVQQLGISKQVIFLGQRWDIPDWLDASDIYILSSEAEGMPLCIMEAMAKGLPVIATAVSGSPEELGDTGKLITNPLQDCLATVRELVSTIQTWTVDAELRRTIGQAGKQRAEKMFTQERMLKEIVEVIEQAFEVQEQSSHLLNGNTLKLNQQLANSIRYYDSVWNAWFKYRQGNLTGMTKALKQSLEHTPFLMAETLIDWVKNFVRFSSEKGEQLNVYSLTSSTEWEQLTQDIFATKSYSLSHK